MRGQVIGTAGANEGGRASKKRHLLARDPTKSDLGITISLLVHSMQHCFQPPMHSKRSREVKAQARFKWEKERAHSQRIIQPLRHVIGTHGHSILELPQ